MYSTRQVLAAMREANPASQITEDHLRHAIRRGDVPPPTTIAGRFLWAISDATSLAAALRLSPPAFDSQVDVAVPAQPLVAQRGGRP